MNTNFPTVELYFVLAFTHCKLMVYAKDEEYIREILSEHRIEFFEHKGEECQEIDTRVLLDLVRTALPEIQKRYLQKSMTEFKFML